MPRWRQHWAGANSRIGSVGGGRAGPRPTGAWPHAGPAAGEFCSCGAVFGAGTPDGRGAVRPGRVRGDVTGSGFSRLLGWRVAWVELFVWLPGTCGSRWARRESGISACSARQRVVHMVRRLADGVGGRLDSTGDCWWIGFVIVRLFTVFLGSLA